MFEILRSHAVRKIDIATDLALLLLISDEEDCCKSSIAESFLTLGKCLQEWLSLNGATLVSESLHLCGILVFTSFFLGLLALCELLVGQHF